MKTKRSAIAKKSIETWKLDSVNYHHGNSNLNISMQAAMSLKKPEQSWKSFQFRFNDIKNETELPVTNRLM